MKSSNSEISSKSDSGVDSSPGIITPLVAAKGEGKSKEKGENAQCEKFAQRKRKLFDKFHGFAAPFLAEENPLPQSPTTKDKVLQG